MLKVLTAYTTEIDEVDVAVEEILGQLDLDHNMGTQSVGIVSCYTEYLQSGVVRALAERLPFDILGITTLANGTAEQMGTLQLCLTVITGDAIQVSTAYSAPLTLDTLDETVHATFAKAAQKLPEKPVMAFAFLPLLPTVAGELIFQKLDKESGNIPIFGALACDDTIEFSECVAFRGDEADRQSMAIALISGDIHPRFFVTSVSDNRIQRQKAVITKSEGYVLHEVNGTPIVEYMESLGLNEQNGLNATRALPFMIDYNDGSKPVARAILQITPSGEVICCGMMPENTTLGIASIDYTEVMKTAQKAASEVLTGDDIHGVLMFSCVVRSYVIGADVLAEIDTIKQVIGDSVPYTVSYCGGELCPMYMPEGDAVNRFHNFTIVACVL